MFKQNVNKPLTKTLRQVTEFCFNVSFINFEQVDAS